MSLFNNSIMMGSSAAGDYEIERSLRFNSADSANLTYTPGSDGNLQKFTFSFWMKKAYGTASGSQSPFSGYAGSGGFGTDRITIMASGSIQIEFDGSKGEWRTTRLLRDPSAWYHIVVAIDSTQGTVADRMKLYVNGEGPITEFDVNSGSNFTQNHSLTGFNNSGQIQQIGSYAYQNSATGSSYFDGYISDFYFIDDQQLTPSSFAETNDDTGQWIPKKYSGTYNAQSYHLTFSDNSGTTATTLGKDSSGNSNNFTPTNLSVANDYGCDSVIDTPTNNFPTYLSIQGPYDGSGAEDVVATFSNGSLDTVTGGQGTYAQAYTTMAFPTTGKWYVETAMTTSYNFYAGVGAFHDSKNQTPVDARVGVDFYSGDGFKDDTGGSTTGIDLGFSQWDNSGGMVLGIALNMDDNEVTFYRDNVAASSAISFTWSAKDKEKIVFYANDGAGAVSTTTTWVNFGQRAFATSDGEPPSGYKRLCSQNLSDPPITKPTDYFGILLWTGTDSVGTRLIDGLDFNPDFHLLKTRTVHAGHWGAFDSVRGVTAGKETLLNAHSAEGTEDGATYGYITPGTGGFTYNTGSAGAGNGNANYNWVDSGTGATYVAWNWKANGSGSSNSSGGITSTVSASTTAGFSIVKYTGTGSATTVGHGLGVKPEVIVVKNLTDGASVPVSISGLIGTGSDTLYWGTKNSAASSQTSVFPATLPTSTVFSVGTHAESNASSKDYIAYCFTPVAGYSKFGTYTGTGQAGTNQGVFIYTGFKPALIIIKRTDSTGNWAWNDHKRDMNTQYGNDASLYGNTTAQETTSSSLNVDFLSNGFKLRSDNSSYNGNGGVYMYMAFAERPFKYANAE